MFDAQKWIHSDHSRLQQQSLSWDRMTASLRDIGKVMDVQSDRNTTCCVFLPSLCSMHWICKTHWHSHNLRSKSLLQMPLCHRMFRATGFGCLLFGGTGFAGFATAIFTFSYSHLDSLLQRQCHVASGFCNRASNTTQDYLVAWTQKGSNNIWMTISR